ncbi:chemotaxis protein CheR [Methylovirgula ligni]|uniref:Chemotaxis protein methyltransferase n=1 Tax=Methylovirgula ligni TaxID=569860 RepID=A0A3D9Z3J1_9HYPH|nr:protein-glutamate O-methyltransferase CheR [Methylovirgula ligni]QAY95765.1 chemotaxis protein CheR [Methylovirgula ligni]REF88858.1 CheR-type MCP methyltransferase [Methylovirgula ligni]
MNSDFDVLRQLLNRRSGLSLDAEKAYLAESRLQPLVQQLGVAGLGGLVKLLLSGSHEDVERDVVEAMTTNETFFFRDRVPFDNFRKVILPHLLQARQDSRKIRIWCAACSSGQEPYSLAMLLDEEAHRLAGWSVEILATDLSRSVVNTARQGIYTQFEVQRGLPISQLLRYFRQEGERWRINEHLQSRIRFTEFNLLSDYAPLGRFDVIFCRNVLIYFDVPTKKEVLDRMAKALAPDGFFIMGAAETVIGLTDAMVPHPEHRSISILRAAAPKPPQRLTLVAS